MVLWDFQLATSIFIYRYHTIIYTHTHILLFVRNYSIQLRNDFNIEIYLDITVRMGRVHAYRQDYMYIQRFCYSFVSVVI